MPANKYGAQTIPFTDINEFRESLKPNNDIESLGDIRSDIAELKELISPKPSIILTGQRVINEYWNLTKK